MLNKTTALVLQLVYIAIITYLSLVAIETKSKISFENADKIVHSLIHVINVILLFIVLYKFKIKHPILIAVLLSILYGIIIEVLQEQFTVKRTFDVFDIMANCLGAIVAAVFLKYYSKVFVKYV